MYADPEPERLYSDEHTFEILKLQSQVSPSSENYLPVLGLSY